MTLKYTRGPWVLVDEGPLSVAPESDAEMMSLAWIECFDYHGECHGNGRLIAMAPEMYEALLLARDTLAKTVSVLDNDLYPSPSDALRHPVVARINKVLLGIGDLEAQ